MAKTGKLYESQYEEALVDLLAKHGWEYTHGSKIHRNLKDTLIADDLYAYLSKLTYLDGSTLTNDDVKILADKINYLGAGTHYKTLKAIYKLIRDGFRYTSSNGICDVKYVDFDNADNNIFRVVNQFEVAYGQKNDIRIPDVLLFVNGIPLCIFELKNPSDPNATIDMAYEQIHKRYMRDIPHLLKYCPLSCISDATANHTLLGTTYTPYEHYYAWKKVNNDDPAATTGIDQVKTIVGGVYQTERFLEILRDYIYFPDDDYDKEEEVVCRYPQFFAARKLRESVLNAMRNDDRRGGTYFGATGCGKTYTMAFLARQLTLRCPELNSPTIIMIVDREDLQSQAGKLFLRSKDFLALGNVEIIRDRQHLKDELSIRETGGFFICTIQKFCESIGLLSERKNIICFSDEAHRTQVSLGKKLVVKTQASQGITVAKGDQLSAENESKIGAFVSKPYAEHLRTAFPKATFVGFTGTPIDETIQVFGEIIDSYNMLQAVEDGITVPIQYFPRMARVALNEERVKEIEEYYKQCAEEGASEEDIAASKKAMSAMEIILGDPVRLDMLAEDIANHYDKACDCKPDDVQKAMIVCSNRTIAFNLLQLFKKHRPDWFEEKKSPDDSKLSKLELDKLTPMPRIAMIATRGKNDDKEMYDYLGDKARRQLLEDEYKKVNSNFKIVIVVDMWITGFDVPCLTYLYNDKPIQKHTLIQTISRVNRKYKNKDKGYIIDYIGIHDNLMQATKTYGGENFGPSDDDVEQARILYVNLLDGIKDLFQGFDLTTFMNADADPMDRLQCLSDAAEFILQMPDQVSTTGKKANTVPARTYYLGIERRLKQAYDICYPSGVLTENQIVFGQCLMAVAGYLRKTSGTTIDTYTMNKAVEKLVQGALECGEVDNLLTPQEEELGENIYGPEFLELLADIKMPATKLEILMKMLRRAIKEYKKINKVAAQKYEELLIATISAYHDRKSKLTLVEATEAQSETTESIIADATKQALEILAKLGEDRSSFRQMGLTFEEKAFYDILMDMRDKHNFVYGEDTPNGNEKCKTLAKKIKELIDLKSSFADWLNNINVRTELSRDIKICLIKAGYPPVYSQEVFDQVMDQVENFKENSSVKEAPKPYVWGEPEPMAMVAEGE